MKLTKRDLCSLAIGIAAGAVSMDLWFRIEAKKHVTLAYDNNRDGIPDLMITHSNRFMVAAEFDRNFDTKMDSFDIYDEGVISLQKLDDNFDDKIDGWYYFTHGILTESIHELDGAPPADSRALYQGGVITWSACLPNGSTNGARVEVYANGKCTKQHCDRDRDGFLDLTLSFDEFGNLLEESPIHPPVPVETIKLQRQGPWPAKYSDSSSNLPAIPLELSSPVR